MELSVRIEKDYGVKLKSKVVDYLDPESIFLPVNSSTNFLFSNNKIYKNELIYEIDGYKYYSPISGKPIRIEEKTTVLGKTKVLEISNDYKEKSLKNVGSLRSINNIKKDELINNIESIDIALANKIKSYNNEKVLVINVLEVEPYMASKVFLMINYVYEILEVTNSLASILNISRVYFAINSTHGEAINKLSNLIGTYPNDSIKIFNDRYGAGYDVVLKTKFNDSTFVLDINDIFKIYYICKRKKAVLEKYITISGNAIKNPMVINVKYGTLLMDVIKEKIRFENIDYKYYVNGLITGKMYDNIDDLIVTDELNGVIINGYEKIYSTKCIRCGKCIKACPVGCDMINNINMDKCIKCNLCSYVCPSRIDLIKGSDWYE